MPDNTYEYFCYCCGKGYRDTSATKPTQCSSCSSTDIQDQYHKSNWIATTDPTVDDDITQGYCVGSHWLNNDTGDIFECADNTESAADWKKLTQMKVYRQDTEPVLAVNDDNVIWYDTSVLDQAWIIFRIAEGDQRKVEMS